LKGFEEPPLWGGTGSLEENKDRRKNRTVCHKAWVPGGGGGGAMSRRLQLLKKKKTQKRKSRVDNPFRENKKNPNGGGGGKGEKKKKINDAKKAGHRGNGSCFDFGGGKGEGKAKREGNGFQCLQGKGLVSCTPRHWRGKWATNRGELLTVQSAQTGT